ncbi:hypothetical protein [Microbacterium aurantiacum]|uniref:hypothetical protein n=1 Tax=Microbacterium aurantiacum TaxID=162393 RepID=UPI0012E93546|nr:hypothetical protein [Microbacterium chocolatum]
MPSAPSITVGVTAEVAEEWSWAAAHARIPQILALTLSLPEALENVRVAVTVEDGPEVFGSTVAFEGELASGVTTPRSVHLPLSARAMAGVDERRAGECVIRVEDRATARSSASTARPSTSCLATCGRGRGIPDERSRSTV